MDRPFRLWHAQQAYGSNQGSENPRVKLQRPRRIDFTERLAVELTPIPCWAHFSAGQYRAALRDLLDVIQREHSDLIEKVPDDGRSAFSAAHSLTSLL